MCWLILIGVLGELLIVVGELLIVVGKLLIVVGELQLRKLLRRRIQGAPGSGIGDNVVIHFPISRRQLPPRNWEMYYNDYNMRTNYRICWKILYCSSPELKIHYSSPPEVKIAEFLPAPVRMLLFHLFCLIAHRGMHGCHHPSSNRYCVN